MHNALVRAARTYAQTFIGLLLAGWVDFASVGDFLSVAQTAAVAAVPAGLALLQNALEDHSEISIPK